MGMDDVAGFWQLVAAKFYPVQNIVLSQMFVPQQGTISVPLQDQLFWGGVQQEVLWGRDDVLLGVVLAGCMW